MRPVDGGDCQGAVDVDEVVIGLRGGDVQVLKQTGEAIKWTSTNGYRCSLLYRQRLLNTHLDYGVCPSHSKEVGGVTSQTGDLELLSYQTDHLSLTDRQGGELLPGEETDVQTDRCSDRQVSTVETDRCSNKFSDRHMARQTGVLTDRCLGLTCCHQQVKRL